MALFAAAGCLGRLGWPIELCSHFRVQYGSLLALATLCYLAGRRWPAALATGLIAAANLYLVVPRGVAPRPVEGRHVLRLLESNLHVRNHDYPRTLDFIRSAKPDIVVLIEVDFGWAEAMRALESEFPHRRAIPAHRSQGIALYSRLPLESVEEVLLGRQDKLTLAIKIRVLLDGRRLTLIGTHPYSPTSRVNFTARNQQFVDLAKLATGESNPVIVLGDLNVSPWSPYFHDLAASSRLVDSRLAFGIQATWPTAIWPLRIPIDHCLVSPEIAVNQRMVGPSTGSDHLPIVVDVSWAEPPPPR